MEFLSNLTTPNLIHLKLLNLFTPLHFLLNSNCLLLNYQPFIRCYCSSIVSISRTTYPKQLRYLLPRTRCTSDRQLSRTKLPVEKPLFWSAIFPFYSHLPFQCSYRHKSKSNGHFSHTFYISAYQNNYLFNCLSGFQKDVLHSFIFLIVSSTKKVQSFCLDLIV